MKINIETIPHNDQRYETAGDYWVDPAGTIQVRISEGDFSPEPLIIHELIEMFLFIKRGGNIEEIDNFDMAFEHLRNDYPHIIGNQEPGNMVSCPAFKEHQIASGVERMMVQVMGLNWTTYDKALDALCKEKK